MDSKEVVTQRHRVLVQTPVIPTVSVVTGSHVPPPRVNNWFKASMRPILSSVNAEIAGTSKGVGLTVKSFWLLSNVACDLINPNGRSTIARSVW
jgi:hypothetical protein